MPYVPAHIVLVILERAPPPELTLGWLSGSVSKKLARRQQHRKIQ